MTKYIFSNIIGVFVFDEKLKMVDSHTFNNLEESSNNTKTIKKLHDKHQTVPLPTKHLGKILSNFSTHEYQKRFRLLNLELTKQKIRESINEDNLINQSVNSIDEIDRIINTLSKRLREWYSLLLPEFIESISNNQKLAELILKKSKDVLKKETKVTQSMGTDLKETDLKAIKDLAEQISSLTSYRNRTETYLESVLKKYCPNLQEIAGTTIAAKLLEHTGTLKKLATLPSSTIQVLGAEKALFRHLKTGAKSPRHGLIINHPLILNSPQKEHGKRSRALADKLSLAARLDYFKGENMGKKLKKELEDRFK